MRKIQKKINSKIDKLKEYETEHPVVPILLGIIGGAILFSVLVFGNVLIDYTNNNARMEAVFEDEEFERGVKEYLHKNKLLESDLLNVSSLEISNNSKLVNIEDVKKFPNLTQLIINNCQVQDISAIGELEKLQVLDLSYNNIYDVTSLGNCYNLQEVNLSRNHIQDILPLCQLENVRELYISSNCIRRLPAELCNLDELMLLDVSANGLCELKEVSKVTSLIELKASANKIVETPDLSNLINLQILDLSGNALYQYLPGAAMDSVIELNVSSNCLKDLNFVDNFPMLKKLNIASNPYKTLSGIEKCKTLESLDIRSTEILEVSILKDLPDFNTIYVNDNFDHSKLDFLIGNFRNADKVTKEYLLDKQYSLNEDE